MLCLLQHCLVDVQGKAGQDTGLTGYGDQPQTYPKAATFS